MRSSRRVRRGELEVERDRDQADVAGTGRCGADDPGDGSGDVASAGRVQHEGARVRERVGAEISAAIDVHGVATVRCERRVEDLMDRRALW